MWNYPDAYRGGLPLVRDNRDAAREALAQGTPKDYEIRITGLEPHSCLIAETLDRDHGSVVDAWIQWGGQSHPLANKLNFSSKPRGHEKHFSKLMSTASYHGQFGFNRGPWYKYAA